MGSERTGRHFTVAVFVVWEGMVLLHLHRKLGMWLPPGGHIERDELPDNAAIREVYEETGPRAAGSVRCGRWSGTRRACSHRPEGAHQHKQLGFDVHPSAPGRGGEPRPEPISKPRRSSLKGGEGRLPARLRHREGLREPRTK